MFRRPLFQSGYHNDKKHHRQSTTMTIRSLIILLAIASASSLQQHPNSRRTFLGSAAAIAASLPVVANAAAEPPALNFRTDTASGIQWADAKVGSGAEAQAGSTVSIDYVLSTTGARYGAKIYSTAGTGAPYRWKLGDGSTIAGLERAITGSGDIPPMRPGGIRRVEIPAKLAYTALGANTSCQGVGPIPPVPDAFEEFQRFKNIYCNPNRAYQPDVVMDIKLYGKRTSD